MEVWKIGFTLENAISAQTKKQEKQALTHVFIQWMPSFNIIDIFKICIIVYIDNSKLGYK